MPHTPREKWIEAGLTALGSGGPDEVRIEKLAQALGVTKGGFYGYFGDRQALLEEMLDEWERMVVDEAIRVVEQEPGDARARLKRLFALADLDESLLRVELAIRAWGRRDAAVAERLRGVDNRRMDFMRGLFGEFCGTADEVEVRCLLAFSLFVGTGFIAAEHGRRSRAEVLALALRELLT